MVSDENFTRMVPNMEWVFIDCCSAIINSKENIVYEKQVILLIMQFSNPGNIKKGEIVININLSRSLMAAHRYTCA